MILGIGSLILIAGIAFAAWVLLLPDQDIEDRDNNDRMDFDLP